MLLECCVDSVASARRAAAGGAGRLELCDSLVEGGITPSYGKIAAVLAAVAIPVNVLIRPRGGDFCYDPDEVRVMEADIKACAQLGAAGVVIGALTPEGDVDEGVMRSLMACSRPLSVTFHRAIDVCRDPLGALDACRRLGVDRVLTSGAAADALSGAGIIRRMVERCRGEALVVMAGGGLTALIARRLIELTGVEEVHGTARKTVHGRMTYVPDPIIYMGGEKLNTPAAEHSYKYADEEAVRSIVDQLVLMGGASSSMRGSIG